MRNYYWNVIIYRFLNVQFIIYLNHYTMKIIHYRSLTLIFLGLIHFGVLNTKAQTIEPYKANEITPYKAKSLEPEKNKKPKSGSTIDVFQGNTITPEPERKAKTEREIVPGTTTSKSNSAQIPKYVPAPKPTQDTDQKPEKDLSNRKSSTNSDLSSFFGLYQYWVPGTAYTVADYSTNTIVMHNSAGTGVLPGGIRINPDGTYIWNSSWDEKVIKGKWSTSGKSDYPIVLLNAQEGRSWSVGKSSDKNADITVWDGNTWYNGKKIKK